ncbi:FAD-dependent oxidoreductase [Clostridiaceae bacterium UIB06]|uniref:FAD-dependent oxidoreductase n=1 Tax=Clostridium thailandense TaxID=2794346 RepID=A0A949THJ9_9CLOT|nr:FAD-dependent oxidoreductase [Clostridium thailandense]MBV7272919.1 FAD-dependent oxidoreductase [Clostridium thailandense]MCH5136270.1 FAD-dependent oxidoreductase [Clostridiaceae bacterium UIB06]
MKGKYPNLLSPITINGMTLRNRTVMPPIGSNFATVSAEVSEEMIKYYELRAKGGTGLIIVENACVDFPMGTNGTKQCRIDDNQYVPGLYTLVERLHAYGAKVSIQLNHAGASAYAARLGGMQPVSASNIPSKTGGAIPRPLTVEEMKGIAKKYGEAAARAQLAGFDSVEIHAGHSYLINQFLSPLFNNRTDEFGGSAENRARFAVMIIDSVREAVGLRFPISIRVSADDMLKGGNTLEDSLELMEFMQEKVDFLNISVGQNDNLYLQHDKMSLAEGWRSYMAKAFKEKFNKPVITSGNIRSPKVAEEIISKGDADLLAMGRGLIAEPYWANKVADGQEHLLRRCISCNIGCADHRLAKSQPIRCSINPDLLFEDSYKEKKVKKDINVVVIGGGTAGLEAACTAAEVGCNVTLLEQKDRLGGLAWMIGTIPAKGRIHYFVEYLENRVKELPNLKIRLNTKASEEILDELNPDLIINATGSKPLLPPIAGLLDRVDKEASKIKSIFGFINNISSFDKECKGKKVVVVGGGAVGLDVVEFFAERGADVSVIEMMPVIGRDLDTNTKLDVYHMMKENKVKQLANTSLLNVNDSSFTVRNSEGASVDISFDYGFVCLGMKVESAELPKIEAYAEEKCIKLLNIGDSAKVRRIISGVEEGRNVVKTLEVMGAFK